MCSRTLNGWMDRYLNGLINKQMLKYKDRMLNSEMEAWIFKWLDGFLDEQLNSEIEAWIVKCNDGWLEGWLDGYVNGQLVA